jgi:hypothetical protein
LTVAVLDENVFVLLAENFNKVSRVIQERATDDSRPSVLKAISASCFIAWVAERAHPIRRIEMWCVCGQNAPLKMLAFLSPIPVFGCDVARPSCH